MSLTTLKVMHALTNGMASEHAVAMPTHRRRQDGGAAPHQPSGSCMESITVLHSFATHTAFL
jgi:hypothetical protein